MNYKRYLIVDVNKEYYIITILGKQVSEIKFKTKEGAKRYIDNAPIEFVINTILTLIPSVCEGYYGLEPKNNKQNEKDINNSNNNTK